MAADDAKRDVLDALIKETIAAAGSIDPAELPHRLRQRLKDHAADDADLDALIAKALKEQTAGK